MNFRPLPYQGSALPLSYGSVPVPSAAGRQYTRSRRLARRVRVTRHSAIPAPLLLATGEPPSSRLILAPTATLTLLRPGMGRRFGSRSGDPGRRRTAGAFQPEGEVLLQIGCRYSAGRSAEQRFIVNRVAEYVHSVGPAPLLFQEPSRHRP